DTLPGVTRTFQNFFEAAEEAGQSRIYAGIHFQFDNVEGQAAGRALGDYVFQNFLTPSKNRSGEAGGGGTPGPLVGRNAPPGDRGTSGGPLVVVLTLAQPTPDGFGFGIVPPQPENSAGDAAPFVGRPKRPATQPR